MRRSGARERRNAHARVGKVRSYEMGTAKKRWVARNIRAEAMRSLFAATSLRVELLSRTVESKSLRREVHQQQRYPALQGARLGSHRCTATGKRARVAQRCFRCALRSDPCRIIALDFLLKR